MSELGQKLITAVREVAAGRPDYIYQRRTDGYACVYVADGEPSCLIGQALWRLGLINAALEPHGMNHGGVSSVLGYLNLVVDPIETSWLVAVQDAQDKGKSWSEAVSVADNYYGLSVGA